MVIRQNRDTLYSAAVFDVDADPVTVTTPDPGARFMSVQVITEDHYVPEVVYGKARRTFTHYRTRSPWSRRNLAPSGGTGHGRQS